MGGAAGGKAGKWGGKTPHASMLAPKMASPQVMGKGATGVVTWYSPSVLPDMVPVIVHPVLPEARLLMIWAKPVSTGTPPSALTKSDCVAEDTRMRRPARSARLAKGFLQNTTWAG